MFLLSFNNKLINHLILSLFGALLIIIPLFVLAGKKITKTKTSIKKMPIKHVKHKHWTKKYDSHFRKYSKHYFGVTFPWRWFKAQGIAESGLRYKAKSRVGAVGLMQILPSTYKDIVKKNPHLGDIKMPKWNIAAGIFYDRQIYKKWKKKGIPDNERLSFTFASYNAGYTKILRAYNKTNKEKNAKQDQWHVVKLKTPGATRAYVHRIKNLMVY